jgi:hypothetical protein
VVIKLHCSGQRLRLKKEDNVPKLLGSNVGEAISGANLGMMMTTAIMLGGVVVKHMIMMQSISRQLPVYLRNESKLILYRNLYDNL